MKNSNLFKKILVPISESGLKVRNYAALLGKKFNSELTVVSIISTGLEAVEEAKEINEETVDLIRSYLNQKYEEILDKSVSHFKRQGIKASSRLVEHIDPAEHITSTATEENVDLILIGNREENGENNYSLGSTTKKVYRHATQSVLIVKDFREPKKILVGFDASTEAQKALDYAQTIASKFESHIKLLHVTPTPKLSNSELSKEEMFNKFTNLGKRILEKVNISDNSQKIDKEVRIGNPADEILEVAEKENFDLITVGSRGLTTVKKYLLGSVSEKVGEQSTISVLIAKD